MKPSKVYKSYNFLNEVLLYNRNFIKKRAYEGKRSSIFLVLSVYNLEGFQEDKKNRRRDLNGIWKEWANRFYEIFQNEF